MADSSSLLPDLLTKLYCLSTKKEQLWTKVGDNTYQAQFETATVQISGTPTPYGLRYAIEQSWLGKTGVFLWDWISLPLKPLLLLATSKNQTIYKWPDRKLSIVTATGQANEFFLDFENPIYSAVSRLLLVAELAIQTDDLATTIENISRLIDREIALIEAKTTEPSDAPNPPVIALPDSGSAPAAG